MKHAVVTGAAGFVGQALAKRLLGLGVQRLTVADRRLDGPDLAWLQDPRVNEVEGDLGSPKLLDSLLAEPVSHLFHLASVPGSLAEREPDLGVAANLTAPLALMLGLARSHAGRSVPRVVFASSIAVYGALSPEVAVSEDTPPAPALSYGTHKLMIELVLADLSRRGELDAVSLRLPGIVARPPAPSGHGSAFMSELIRRGVAGQPYECPVGPEARCWWMSLPACVDNLMHAAMMANEGLPASRVVQLPVLAAAVSELVHAIEAQVPRWSERLTWRPDAALQRLFGAMPPLHTPAARVLGFADDGNLSQLIRRALQE